MRQSLYKNESFNVSSYDPLLVMLDYCIVFFFPMYKRVIIFEKTYFSFFWPSMIIERSASLAL